ncbi:MAG: hypothetical protein JOZ46_07930 [Candidatus Dormibacteraeota bacterium]|nr:hypothetical protein [Candidatus Dormibacteraeota bacterium]MBV9525726.1 hypothetical protein [Candidatus Dormibacteraeota bacterium]
MYGTIMRARVKPDRKDEYVKAMTDMAPDPSVGFVGVQIGWEDKDPNNLVLVVVFKDRDSYVRNAEAAETDEMYRKQLEYLEGEPEWIDVNWTEYIGAGQRAGAGA